MDNPFTLTTVILTLLLGVSWGLLFAIVFLFYRFKINCPKCKQPKPLKEIAVFCWKEQNITGKPCLSCQNRPKREVDIY